MIESTRTGDRWWAWHDKDQARWSTSTEEAERRCAAWVAGESDDGPEDDVVDPDPEARA